MNMKNKFLEKLIKTRFRSNKEVRQFLDEHEKNRRRRPLPLVYSGVYQGVFFRVRVPPKKSFLPDVPKLPSSRPPPQSFKKVDHVATTSLETPSDVIRDVIARMREWLAENWSVLVFNFGSICTLVGFTRSDVLELRIFSATGSFCGVAYNLVQRPLRWPPLVWGLAFAGVNMFKIFQIVRERSATVHLTAREEEVYVRHFLPHGVTPKQFEVLAHKAKTIQVKKGEILIRQGEKLNHVYLVIEGATQASILGRHLTAASVNPTAHKEKKGGASGAWIGEMAFLENYWIKEQGKTVSESELGRKKEQIIEKSSDKKEAALVDVSKQATTESDPNATKPVRPRKDTSLEPKSSVSLYTIIAKEDCTILQWSHADIETLMQRSTDMRAAMTRAMAAAIVGKVINFTVSNANRPSWTSWLSDWKQADGTRISVDSVSEQETVSTAKENDAELQAIDERLPQYPIRKFRE